MLDTRYRSILSMAIPLMGSSFIQSVVMITDSSFMSRYSTIEFDAAGNGGLLYITMFIMLIGLNDGAQILMARRIGQKEISRLSKLLSTTLLTNFLFAVTLFICMQFLLPIAIETFTTHPGVAEAEIRFIDIRSYAVFFGMVSLAISAYFMANGKTLVVLLSAIITAISNILLDYLLIFGKHGFPEMGIEGAALASTLAESVGMLFLITALIKSKLAKEQFLFHDIGIRSKSIIELLRLSSPIMLQGLIALSTWTVFFTWIEQMGTYELTVSQNIRSLYFLAFVPIWGFASTTKTYVSQFLGNNDLRGIRIIQKRIILLTLAFLVLFFHGALLYPETLIRMINPNEIYVQESADILRFISGSVIIFGIGSVFFQTINGSGNTRYTFFIELVAVILYLALSYFLIKVYNLSIYWIWSVEYIYFISMAGLSIAYLSLSSWHKKQI